MIPKAFIPNKKSGKNIKELLKNKRALSNMKEGVYQIIWPKDCILKVKPDYLLLIRMDENRSTGIYPLRPKGGKKQKGKYTYMKSKPNEPVSGIGYVKPLEDITLGNVRDAIQHEINHWVDKTNPRYDFSLKRVGGLEKLASDMDPLVEAAKKPITKG